MKRLLYFTVLASLFFLTGCGEQENVPDKFIRKSVYSDDVARDLEALDKALEIMRSKDCSDPLSWYYQGAMHWIPDTINGPNRLCDSYQTMADLKEAWDNCTHTESGAEEIHFLVWHRLYTWHFERIVRKLSGYADFALPYWGYTDTLDTLQSRTMPAIFRTGSTHLFEPARLDSLNNGFPISGKATRRLSLSKLNEYRLYALYNENINSAPHGAMHNYIGFGNDIRGKSLPNSVWQQPTNGMMSEVATAAFDPIFWVHHANIDRIWQQWTNSENGQNVLLEELKAAPWPYVFFDENGEKVTYTIEEVVENLYKTDYDYDDTPVAPKTAPELREKRLNLAAVQTKDTLAKITRATSLNNKVTNISLANLNREKANLLSAANPEGEILILNVTVSFTKAPKGDFEVYLNLPTTETPTPESDHFAGFMTFFGADHQHTGHQHHAPDSRTRKTFRFEITPEALHSNALEKEAFELSIHKFDGSGEDDIRIDHLSIIKH